MTGATRGYRRVVRALRKAAEPGPEGFTWRGIRFSALPDGDGLYGSETTELAAGRTANWRVERHASGLSWHARLKIGGDRFPGVGKTPAEALEAATAEAANVAAYIVAMLRPSGALRDLSELTSRRRRPSKRGAR